MNSKRSIHTTSPEYTERSDCKKFAKNMESANCSNSQDMFSWDKLCSLLDEKLKDVTRKSDLNEIKTEINELRQENLRLKNDVKRLSSRLEYIDRRSRSTNIIVSGLNSTNNNAAKQEIENICSDVLNVKSNVVYTRMIAGGKSFCFTLESSLQAYNVSAAKKKLKGKKIFINKDYTEQEQYTRYSLRNLSKAITKHNKSVKVRLGEFCIFIDNNKYTFLNGKIMARSNNSADFLQNLLAQCIYNVEICIGDDNQPNNDRSSILSSQ